MLISTEHDSFQESKNGRLMIMNEFWIAFLVTLGLLEIVFWAVTWRYARIVWLRLMGIDCGKQR